MFRHSLYILLIIQCSSIILPAQDIFTRDGTNIGSRETYMQNCVGNDNSKDIHLEGFTINIESLCNCYADRIIPLLNYSELLEAAQNEGELETLFSREDILLAFFDCAGPDIKIDDDVIIEFTNELSYRTAYSKCVAGVSDNINPPFSSSEAATFCACAIEKINSIGLKYSEFVKFEFHDQEAFNGILLPCYNQIENESNALNKHPSNDVTGPYSSSNIYLVEYPNTGYKIRVAIDGVVRYYLFDTGASDLCINRDLERELILNGTLKREDYLEKRMYELADGRIVEGQPIRLNNVKIGKYMVNNVIAVILDEGGMLFGMGLLDKFSNWSFDKKSATLTLYR